MGMAKCTVVMRMMKREEEALLVVASKEEIGMGSVLHNCPMLAWVDVRAWRWKSGFWTDERTGGKNKLSGRYAHR